MQPPVFVDHAMVETPLLLSEKGAAITLLNWSGAAVDTLEVRVRLPFAAKSVTSGRTGALAFRTNDGEVTFVLPLKAADVVAIRP